MKLQMLVSAVNQNVHKLAAQMQLACDTILINQCSENEYEEFQIEGGVVYAYSFAEKGVGLSRNNALMRADSDICLFADEDIIYEKGYVNQILTEFEKHPEADILLFNVCVVEERRTYFTSSYKRVGLHNSGRYPAYSIAARTEKLHRNNITFSLLFGGGARYSNGEDSLFLRDCLKAGLKIYRTPICIGKEEPRQSGESTWFFGYNEKFFFDRGVLYEYLYGILAKPVAIRFLLKHKNIMCHEISWKKAYHIMCEGLKEARKEK